MTESLRRRHNHFERNEQLAIMEWAAYHPLLCDFLIHIPNGEYRTKSTGSLLKKMGVKCGIPDLFCPLPRGKYSGLWIELKSSKAPKCRQKPSEMQQVWLDRLNICRYKAVLCVGVDDAIKVLKEYVEMSSDRKES